MPATIDPVDFRHVLGHLPTGVVAVTAMDAERRPAGMAVGTFLSVSLDPPLVGFLPAKSSSTFPRIREAGSFCANVLTARQETVCRSLSARGADKFAGLAWRPAPSGAPILDGVLAWIDCDITQVIDAGDHHIVLGRVRELKVSEDGSPLVFFRGGYGAFREPFSLTAPAQPGMIDALRAVDVARPWMEELALAVDAECLATVVVGDQVEVVGSAGRRGSRIGQRTPFVAPIGVALAAWAPSDAVRGWEGSGADPDRYRDILARVRERGWSIVVDSPAQRHFEELVVRPGVGRDALLEAAQRLELDEVEPADTGSALRRGLRSLSAPVKGPHGEPVLLLSLYSLPRPTDPGWFEDARAHLTRAADAVAGQLLAPAGAGS